MQVVLYMNLMFRHDAHCVFIRKLGAKVMDKDTRLLLSLAASVIVIIAISVSLYNTRWIEKVFATVTVRYEGPADKVPSFNCKP